MSFSFERVYMLFEYNVGSGDRMSGKLNWTLVVAKLPHVRHYVIPQHVLSVLKILLLVYVEMCTLST